MGGSIAHADPASELPAVALALDATLEVASASGAREIAATDFFEGTWSTTLADDEILVGVRFPVWTGRCGYAVREIARRSGDFAIAGVATAVQLDDADRIAKVAIGVFGVASTPVRAGAAEAALVGNSGAALADAAQVGAAEIAYVDDLHATGAYRRRVTTHLVQTAVDAAIQEASGVRA